MLTITIPASEGYDEVNNEFINTKQTTLQLEHSLLSLHKWEQKWHIPFLASNDKTQEQTVDYIRCMTITPNVDPFVYRVMPKSAVMEITKYIENPMTATWFSDDKNKQKKLIGAQKNSSEIVTAEIIYYWMIALNIPVEYRKWHLNSLLTLIRVVSLKNAPKDSKVGSADWARQRSALNAQRRAKYHTRG